MVDLVSQSPYYSSVECSRYAQNVTTFLSFQPNSFIKSIFLAVICQVFTALIVKHQQDRAPAPIVVAPAGLPAALALDGLSSIFQVVIDPDPSEE